MNLVEYQCDRCGWVPPVPVYEHELPIHHACETFGLGDVIAWVAKRFGATPRSGCGCEERRRWLNAWLSFDWLRKWRRLTITRSQGAGPMAKNRKAVATGVIGGPLAVVLVWLIHVAGYEIPQEVAAAIATLINVIVAAVVKDEV